MNVTEWMFDDIDDPTFNITAAREALNETGQHLVEGNATNFEVIQVSSEFVMTMMAFAISAEVLTEAAALTFGGIIMMGGIIILLLAFFRADDDRDFWRLTRVGLVVQVVGFVLLAPVFELLTYYDTALISGLLILYVHLTSWINRLFYGSFGP